MPESQRRPTLRSYTSGNTYFYGAVTVGIIVLVVSAIMSSYRANLTDRINALDGQMVAGDSARNKENEQELIAASQQSKVMKRLLANKSYWSQALQRMQQMMQTSVKLTRMDATAEKGTIAFQATADSYASVARQLAAFSAAIGVNDITVNTIKATTRGTVEFNGTLLIDTKTMLSK